MSKDTSLVQRLISFLKKPNALEYTEREPVRNPYDDYAPKDYEEAEEPEPPVEQAPEEMPFMSAGVHAPHRASRLDALMMRAVDQFRAHTAFVIRYDADGRMHYCTGRDQHGEYVSHTDANADRRAIFFALDSGESQLFVSGSSDMPTAVLCGPLWVGDEVVGVLYLDSPARSHLRRGVFDVFCDQAARMLADGVDH